MWVVVDQKRINLGFPATDLIIQQMIEKWKDFAGMGRNAWL